VFAKRASLNTKKKKKKTTRRKEGKRERETAGGSANGVGTMGEHKGRGSNITDRGRKGLEGRKSLRF